MPYSAVRIEGLFPSDLIERIASGEGVPGQSAADFGLATGTRVTDELQSAYSDVRAHWDAFQRRRAHSQASLTSITRDAWVLPVLERLGHVLVFQRSTQVEGESFVISHRAGEAEDSPPVNIVAFDQGIDERADTSRRTPHAAVQEYLNRTDVVWGVVTNGDRLRLLRNAVRLSRPTYVEFDLAAIVEDNLYSEFVLLYRLLHRTRLPRTSADTESWMEKYYQQGLEEGGRVRERLREGVERAIVTIANGLLAHRSSETLRQRLQSGDLLSAELYRQLLRLVYRLLFLMVVEERRLVVPSGAQGSGPDVYLRHYGLGALRERSERYIGTDLSNDLWLRLIRVFEIFRDETTAAAFGLKPFDGELFALASCGDLESAGCGNDSLLRGIRSLSTFDDDGVPRRVNFAALDVEELGSVYEALLEYAPVVDTSANPPKFVFEAGAERRSTGSYYTPQSLVQELVEAALVPVMQERLTVAKDRASRERALLDLHVLDLAAGSGHFLLAAGRRIARELARVRAGGNEPTPKDFRDALRDVIRSCLVAVDKNPLAVDLCKVALWIESHEAGLPLAFLDHRVKLGDTLVGVATVSAMEGIPDGAFVRSHRDQRARAKTLRDRNERERAGQQTLISERPSDIEPPAQVVEAIVREPDDTIERVRTHEDRYLRSRIKGGPWWREKAACALWTAPFLADLRGAVPTTGTLRAFRSDPTRVDVELVEDAIALVDGQFKAVHWTVEFPDVAARGGFDVVLSNPPFMGGYRISTNFGDDYRRYLLATCPPAAGTADLCAFFFRRAFDLLRPGGRLGMIGTKTLHEGDTRRAGLVPILLAGGVITKARRSIPWPAELGVVVDLVTISRGVVPEHPLLDDRAVAYVSSRLDEEPELEVTALRANANRAFEGSIPLGMGFTLEPAEAEALLARDPRNAECLFPYLNGRDLNTRLDQSPTRWIIQFDERSEAEARAYPDLWDIVKTRVYPDRRSKDAKKYPRMVNEWWKHWNNRQELYRVVRPLERALVRAQVSSTHEMCLVSSQWIYDQKVVVFGYECYYEFGLLQSHVHEEWVRRYSSTLAGSLSYTPTDCFSTFPFPDPPRDERQRLASIAEAYDRARLELMTARDIGLTKVFNAVNDPTETDDDVERLRRMRVEIDQAALACYGWSNLDLRTSLRDGGGRPRFAPSPEARVELLRRLAALNVERSLSERAP